MQSCSKTFTATVTLLAVMEGLVELDRPIVDYLPGFHLQSRFNEFPVRKINPLEELLCWLILAGGKGRDVLQKLRALK